MLADYVTMDSGTGCVHTAPGFGADDYQTCKRYGMDMVVPVDDQGRHTDYAGKYAGMIVDESNPVILKDMQEAGVLFASEEIVHSYPHCWRCKKPIIFRATRSGSARSNRSRTRRAPRATMCAGCPRGALTA